MVNTYTPSTQIPASFNGPGICRLRMLQKQKPLCRTTATLNNMASVVGGFFKGAMENALDGAAYGGVLMALTLVSGGTTAIGTKAMARVQGRPYWPG